MSLQNQKSLRRQNEIRTTQIVQAKQVAEAVLTHLRTIKEIYKVQFHQLLDDITASIPELYRIEREIQNFLEQYRVNTMHAKKLEAQVMVNKLIIDRKLNVSTITVLYLKTLE